MTTLLIATRNAHKVREIRGILGDQIHYLNLNEFPDAPEVVEDAATFAGNATKKSTELAKWLSRVRSAECGAQSGRNASRKTGDEAREGKGAGDPEPTFVLADDSGLEVDALAGAPGVHSARFAAVDTGEPGNSSTAENNAKLLHLLKTVTREKRTARFRCVLALTPVLNPAREPASPVCYADELETQTELFEGNCEGRIEFTARGKGGFGYDPLFVPNGYKQTFAELGEAVKNGLSHRALALAKLKTSLKI